MIALKQILPVTDWLPNYRTGDLRGDLVAGLTTAVMLIPQAMAYAMLAGLPPVVGLYASIVPLVLYALFGTSRQLAVGPVAMVSLLVATGVGQVAETGTELFIAYAVVLSLMVGALQLLMGIARLGFLTNFLSHPVLSGFTSAAALIIGFSQIKHLLGLDIPRSHHVHEVLLHAAAQLGQAHGLTVLIGAGSIALLVTLKRVNQRFPAALVVVALSTLVVWLLGLDARGVRIVGEVPAGLPSPQLPGWDPAAMRALLPTAVTIALVGFMESIAVAKAFAKRGRYEVDANQELVGLGVANLGGAVFQAYPVTGGFSRTAVNAEAGARTGLASLITAAVIAITLVLLTPLFYHLPKAVLAAIIITAVFGLIDVREVRHLWRVKREDLVLLGVTFVATLGVGIEQGILIGVGVSLLWFVVKATRPHFAILGRLPSSREYRNVGRWPEAEQTPGVLAVRIDAQLYFGNVSFLKETLRRLEATAGTRVHSVVIDATSINNLDSSADAALRELHDDYVERGIFLYLAGTKGPVLDVMSHSGLTAQLGAERLWLTVADAVDAAVARAARDGGSRSRRDEPARDEVALPPPLLSSAEPARA